ncbi:Nucleolar pre-ribosomal-associated protein 1-like [Oopsacas minuta]|uniref:Nucleolar pre-ribosomal-associated protein 1-like n=1 Tax=Oopsacas minuta TaxID=111878 RepID=A0AAV7K2Y8_9METZ|nr:Nucleolar pre-ribosomal-associated protein 1-like [Oopsacas minuta]
MSNSNEASHQLHTITSLLCSNELQIISAGLKLLLTATDTIWNEYLQSAPECGHIIQCLSMGKTKITSDILEKCWKILTRVYASDTIVHLSTNILHDVVSKYLKHIFHSLSRNSPETLTMAVLGFLSSAVLYDNQHANLIMSHCNLAHNIYHYMFSHKSRLRPSIIKFVLSFFMTDDFQLIRTLLEIKVVFNNIFKYIKHDPIDLSYFIIAIIAKKIFSPEISKKLKIGVFSSSTMIQIFHLLDKDDEVSLEDDSVTFQLREQGFDSEVIPFCDYVEVFIKILCTSERFGLCYLPKIEMINSYKYNNPAILYILKAIPYSMRVGNKVERLIIELLHSSPDITYNFLSEDLYLIIPQIQSEWVNTLEFLIKFYRTLPLKASIQKTSLKSALINLNLSSLSALLFPPQTAKLHFNQGILHQNYLCKYLTAQFLTCLLTNYSNLHVISNSVPESKFDIGSFIESIRFKLPDVMIIIAQLKLTSQMTEAQFTDDIDKFGCEISSKYGHLRDKICETFLITFLKLLLLYQELYPLSILQANYSVSKLLTNFTMSNESMLIALRIVNQSPAGAIKWLDANSTKSPLGLLINIYLLTDLTPSLHSEIELCFMKFTREMPHLCVNPLLINLTLTTIKSMVGTTILPNVNNYVTELGNFLVRVISYKSFELNFQSDGLSCLVKILEENIHTSSDDFAFFEIFWLLVDVAIYQNDEDLVILLFYLFSKLLLKTGLIQRHMFTFYSQCFDLLLSKANTILNFPLPCQIIYKHLLEFLVIWIHKLNNSSLTNMKLIILSIEDELSEFQRNTTSLANNLIHTSDIQKLFEFQNGIPTDFIVNILKYIPYGFAQYMLNETNTLHLTFLSEITSKLDFHEWIFQSCALTNFHLDANTGVATNYANFLLQLQPIINLYFQSIDSVFDHQCLIDYSEFCGGLLCITNHLCQTGKTVLIRIIQHFTSIAIQTSKYFELIQNNRTIASTYSWWRSLIEPVNIESKAKRLKVTDELTYETLYSLLLLITSLDCDKPKCILDFYLKLTDRNEILSCDSIVDFRCNGSEIIDTITIAIHDDILASLEHNNNNNDNNKQQTVGNYSDSCVYSEATWTDKEMKIINLLQRDGIECVNSLKDNLAFATQVLLKVYKGTLSKDDQNILNIFRTLEVTDNSECNLKPFVWGDKVLHYMEYESKAFTHVTQSYNPNNILLELSIELLNETISQFPVYRVFDEVFDSKLPEHLYDPCFLLPLFSFILAPGVDVDCRKFAELGCLGVLFRCLSSLSYDVRASAAHCLDRYTTHMSYNSFREKRQISLILDITANTICEDLSRIPSIHTSFLARTVPILLHPNHDLFLLLTKFLLSKPNINTEELPLLKTMILSSSPVQKREKIWMIKLLIEGILCEEDYKFYKRRHIFSLLFSMCDPVLNELQICLAIIKFALKVSSLHFACRDLVSYEGLGAWAIHLCTQLKHISESQEKNTILECLDEIVLRACDMDDGAILEATFRDFNFPPPEGFERILVDL